MKKIGTLIIALLCGIFSIQAQELNMKITINHAQIEGTDASVFDNLQETLTRFINDRQWTNLQFRENERINCNLNITITQYDKTSNTFKCKAIIQANRPVFNSTYTTTIYNNTDPNFDFEFAQFDQLEYNEENRDNQLVALCAYYAYLIIGLNLDTFAPNGGEDILQKCMNLANNCQTFTWAGWESFKDDRNRFAIINDYLDNGFSPFRKFQYTYYRKGLDQMADSPEKALKEITNGIETELKQAKDNKPMSMLPQIWTDYKRDEIASMYKVKATQKEKESVYDILFNINPSQNNAWQKIKE